MRKPRIIFFDIDGTLIDMEKKQVTPLMLDTLHRLQANGIRLAIATGRSPMTVPLWDFPGVQFDVLVTFNGAYCYDKNRVLFASPIPAEDVRTLRRNAAALGRPLCVATESTLAANGNEQDLDDYFAVAKIPVPVTPDFDTIASGTVYQIMMGGRKDEYSRILQDVRGAKIAAWWDRAVDIIPAAGGKGNGIAVVLQAYGIPKADAMAFGDGNNDLEMFGAVGTCVAMANGSADLKAAATHLCGSCAEDGVLCTVATMAFYVLYLVGFKWGANGYLLAIISGDLSSVLFLMFTGKLWNYVELKGINKDLWKQMLRFSLPMIPAQISFWIINASDLFFVREMCSGLDGRDGNAWSGLLSTGYFLPTILTTLGLIFYDAWQLSAVTEEEGRAKFFTKIFRTYSSVLFCCAAGIIWLCRPVMHIMKSNYYYAWHFVPFLVLASTCSCFNQFMNSVYVVNKKSTRSMITMMAGAVSNCIMNYFFIKWWGPVGATYASFLGLALVFTLRAIDAHRMIGMQVHPGRVLVNAAALVIEAFVLLAETPLYGLWTGIITALIILYNFAGVWAMARVLLPKLLGRRGKALVNVIDGWIAPKKA